MKKTNKIGPHLYWPIRWPALDAEVDRVLGLVYEIRDMIDEYEIEFRADKYLEFESWWPPELADEFGDFPY